MCCAMTSPEHLVALPSLSSALNPLALLDTGLCFKQQGALLLRQHRQDQGTEVEVCCCCSSGEAFVSPSPLGSMCSSYILLFVCSCNVVGWMPERVVVIVWFSVID